MAQHTLYATVKVVVESELPLNELIDELGSESYYTIDSSEHVTVVQTEWLDTSTQSHL